MKEAQPTRTPPPIEQVDKEKLEHICRLILQGEGFSNSEFIWQQLKQTYELGFTRGSDELEQVKSELKFAKMRGRQHSDEAWRKKVEASEASESREKNLKEALEKLIVWLDNDTLEIMKDTIKMGITFDWSDCQQLREQIEEARRALEGE